MEPTGGTATRSSPDGRLPDDTGLDSLQFREVIQRLITTPPEDGTSFTALLVFPATQAMELLNASNSDGVSKRVTLFNGDHKPFYHPVSVNSTAPPISSPVQLAAKFPDFTVEQSPEANSTFECKFREGEEVARLRGELYSQLVMAIFGSVIGERESEVSKEKGAREEDW